jgi:GTP cyclohydrolase II
MTRSFAFLLLVLACTKSATCKSEAFPTSFLPRSRLTLFATTTRGGATLHQNTATLTKLHGEQQLRDTSWSSRRNDDFNNNMKKINGKKPKKSEDINEEEESLSKTNLDQIIPAEFVAETSLPTDLGNFRLRAYRADQSDNRYVGTEPCVIYATDKPPFGEDGKMAENVPIRVHDQCFTSEVFRSQR